MFQKNILRRFRITDFCFRRNTCGSSSQLVTFVHSRLYCCGEPKCVGYLYNNGWCAIGDSVDDCHEDPSQGFVGAYRSLDFATVKNLCPNRKQRSRSSDEHSPKSCHSTEMFPAADWVSIDVPHDYVVATNVSSGETDRLDPDCFQNFVTSDPSRRGMEPWVPPKKYLVVS